MIGQLEDYFHKMENLDKLYLILLTGAVVRAPLYFVNFDSRVYELWLQFFLSKGYIPYMDHPPLMFFVSGLIETFFGFLQFLNPYIYFYILFIPLGYLYFKMRDRSIYLLLLLSFLTTYIWFVGFLGNSYEIASMISYLSGLVLIYLSYLLGESLSEDIGVYAALFTAFAWWPVVYSKVLLIDNFSASLIVLAYILYDRLLRAENPSRKLWVSTTLALMAAFYTKYYALLIVPAIGIYSIFFIQDVKKLFVKAVPGALSISIFGIWLYLNDFFLFNHYAATHYLFLKNPSPMAIMNFFSTTLTPLLLIFLIYGIYTLADESYERAVFLLIPVIIAFGFHVFQAFILGRSHSLINLTNYMLYTFPMISVTAAAGWEKISSSISYQELVTLMVALTFLVPIIQSSIVLEYDSGYEAPATSNLNSLKPSQLEALPLNPETLHYTYSFERKLMLWSDYDPMKAHFRWLNPFEVQILALEPESYNISVSSVGESSNLEIYRNNDLVQELNVSKTQYVLLKAQEGKNIFRFETKSGEISFIAKRQPK